MLGINAAPTGYKRISSSEYERRAILSTGVASMVCT